MKKILIILIGVSFFLTSVSFGRSSLSKLNLTDNQILNLKLCIVPYLKNKRDKDRTKICMLRAIKNEKLEGKAVLSSWSKAKKYLIKQNAIKVGEYIEGEVKHEFYKDEKYIYYDNLRITNDVKNRKYLGGLYSKDSNNIYYDEYILKGADIDTFEYFGGGSYAKDKYNLYWKDRIYKKGESMDTFNFDTLIIFTGMHILMDKKGIYLNDDFFYFKDADFYNLFKDRNCELKVISKLFGHKLLYEVGKETIDESYLNNIVEDQPGELNYRFVFSEDEQEIKTAMKRINLNFSIGEFENVILAGGSLFYDLDNKSFEVLGFSHAKDKNTCLFIDHKLKGCDVITFVPIDRLYAKDKNHYYYKGEILTGKDLQKYLEQNNKKN